MAGTKNTRPERNEALYPNSIGYCIKKYGYTRSEVANEIGIARKSLYLYCSGRLAPPRYTLTKIARTPGCSVEELMAAPAVNGKVTTVVLASQLESPSRSGETFEYSTLALKGDESVNRRDFLRETGHSAIAGTLLLTSRDILGDELLNRFRLALKQPSTLDDKLFHYLERQTEVYWQDRHSATLLSSDLLDYVLAHFQKATRLLEGSPLPAQCLQLCAIASKSALLIGEIYLDMGYYARAR
ncbi:MAG: helix-turn-helix transcriptional regulator [Ktedonobacteraceae bacterium]